MNMTRPKAALKTVDDQIESLKALGQNALSLVGEGRSGMTTVTIAEITGRQHKDVLKKARKFLEDIEATVGGQRKFAPSSELVDAQEFTYLNEQHKEQPMLVLSRDVAQAFLGTYNAKLAFATTVHLNHLLDQIDPLRSMSSVTSTIAETLKAAGAIRERERCDWTALRGYKKAPQRSLSPDEKEQQKWTRQAKAYDEANPMR
ncbi:hypothetical protein PS874_00004 [Pseudomonas fluorescens]|nr:hypothetical protein PS874_00004 [Pseudomonas fluorescens]